VRPDIVFGFTQKVKTGLGELYLTVNEVDGSPSRSSPHRQIRPLGHGQGRGHRPARSLALRSGVDVADIVGQLKGIGGENPVFQKKGLLLSIPDAVSWVLENRYLQGQKYPRRHRQPRPSPNARTAAPKLVFEEAATSCKNCGYTKCG